MTLRDRADQVAPYLGSNASRGAAALELGAAAVVAAVVALGVLGVGPLGAVSTTAWATVTVVVLAGFGLLRCTSRGPPRHVRATRGKGVTGRFPDWFRNVGVPCRCGPACRATRK